MLRFTGPLFAGVMTVAVGMASSASAQTIDFDRLPNGQAVPNGTVVTTQYSSLGVTFSSPAPAGGPTAGVFANEASSAPNILTGLNPATQAGVYPIDMTFAAPYTDWVNVTLISVGCATVTATAYSADASVVDSISLSRGPDAGVGLGNHNPISLAGPGIARVRFEITQQCPEGDGFGIDDVQFSLFGGVPFSGFDPTATLTLKSGTSDDVLALKGTFSLGLNSDGIDPLTQDVTVLIGRFSRTISAGQFKVTSTGTYSFKGTVGGAALNVSIPPPTGGVYTFSATVKSTDLPTLSSPVSVGLRIGNDGGSADLSTVKVTATR